MGRVGNKPFLPAIRAGRSAAVVSKPLIPGALFSDGHLASQFSHLENLPEVNCRDSRLWPGPNRLLLQHIGGVGALRITFRRGFQLPAFRCGIGERGAQTMTHYNANPQRLPLSKPKRCLDKADHFFYPEGSSMSDPKEDAKQKNIEMRAYLLWEMEGEQEGRSDEYWHRARELIEAESQSGYPPTQSRGYRT